MMTDDEASLCLGYCDWVFGMDQLLLQGLEGAE